MTHGPVHSDTGRRKAAAPLGAVALNDVTTSGESYIVLSTVHPQMRNRVVRFLCRKLVHSAVRVQQLSGIGGAATHVNWRRADNGPISSYSLCPRPSRGNSAPQGLFIDSAIRYFQQIDQGMPRPNL